LNNFNFYLQVLSAQYKAEDALETLRKIETLGMRPTDETYNHVMTAFAKNRNL
jgi:pentatricopeptide repeat protein